MFIFPLQKWTLKEVEQILKGDKKREPRVEERSGRG